MRVDSLSCLPILLFAIHGALVAQETNYQSFQVIVPTNASITAPSDVSITHDESESDQRFPQQAWIVKGNVASGISVTFETDRAFTHAENPAHKRNVELSLGIANTQGPAQWTLAQQLDMTDYEQGDEIATVQAASNNVGRAEFSIGVKFITDTFGTFAPGAYETTVIGTISAP